METIKNESFVDQRAIDNWLKMAEIDLALLETIYSISGATVDHLGMESQ
jgi:hypothetical protein